MNIKKEIIKFLNEKYNRSYTLEDFFNNIDIKDWIYNISTYQSLSEDFIEKYKNYIDWNKISIYQKLSEKFIKKYKNKVNWYWISRCQNLSENFIYKMRYYVDWSIIEDKYNIRKKQFIIEYVKSVNRKETNIIVLNI